MSVASFDKEGMRYNTLINHTANSSIQLVKTYKTTLMIIAKFQMKKSQIKLLIIQQKTNLTRFR